VQSAVSKNADVVIIDTAGRYITKRILMDELGKIRRVISKVIPDAPHEVLLILDGSTVRMRWNRQNILLQQQMLQQ
jgi:fused signal recognition particle receptor